MCIRDRLGRVAADVATGLEAVFNAALGPALTYTFERYQYFEALEANPTTPMSEIYGPEHLVRLLSILGPHLTTYGMTCGDREVDCIDALTKHLELNFDSYFVDEYELPAPQYMRALTANGM